MERNVRSVLPNLDLDSGATVSVAAHGPGTAMDNDDWFISFSDWWLSQKNACVQALQYAHAGIVIRHREANSDNHR